ncbi:Polypeptide N-acetylgalactosaminyltransferase 5 [Bulinus truncatus]|nr:Polypeptide N-acetylgalactosaminyltransferase 5 [Bulinus truncatus]
MYYHSDVYENKSLIRFKRCRHTAALWVTALLQVICLLDANHVALAGARGENGRSYHWRPNELTSDELIQKEKDFRIHSFDDWLSRKISVRRSLPDDRRPECKATHSYLPSASVVIVFHNEAWSALLRTIHSILDRTPKKLLHEIVLLDDFSDMDHLKDPLEAYIKPLSKVKLFRSSKRLGLIKARNYAFEYSKGKIVIFLDSHIECYPGWIEPLVAPILNDSRVITYPTIEIISGTTFGTAMNSKLERTVGGLMLNSLSFNWLYDRKHNVTSRPLYYQSPTMPGGLYAVSRDWFSKLGKNDPEMEYWGGENIEMSFKCQNFWVVISLDNVSPELAKKMDIAGVYYGEQWQFGTDQRVVSGDFILAARMETKSGKEKLELMLTHDRGVDQKWNMTTRAENKNLMRNRR